MIRKGRIQGVFRANCDRKLDSSYEHNAGAQITSWLGGVVDNTSTYRQFNTGSILGLATCSRVRLTPCQPSSAGVLQFFPTIIIIIIK